MLYECVSGELIWGTDETLAHLEKVLDIYRNGHYLKNNTQTHKTGEWPTQITIYLDLWHYMNSLNDSSEAHSESQSHTLFLLWSAGKWCCLLRLLGLGSITYVLHRLSKPRMQCNEHIFKSKIADRVERNAKEENWYWSYQCKKNTFFHFWKLTKLFYFFAYKK